MTIKDKSHVEIIKEEIQISIEIKKTIIDDSSVLLQLENLVNEVCACIRNGNKVIFAGNGGSFADAQHLSAEFVSRFMFDRAPLASVVLGANNSAISAIGNDYGYDQVFAREIQAIAKQGDIFIPISTSGNSINIIKAVSLANDLKIKTFALTGISGGLLKDLCQCICIPSNETAKIQECHIMIGHIMCGLVEKAIFNS
jgi:D-sedoheptulose 7-phosphate isomerase